MVSDSEQSQPDIDFQQDFTQHASWQGFFDRESGVMFYKYAFSDACLTAKDFTVPPTSNVRMHLKTHIHKKYTFVEMLTATALVFYLGGNG